MTTCEHQISKAKKEIIQNTDKKFAEMTEKIQQLEATISIFIEQIPRPNESPNQHNYEHIESSKYSSSKTNSEELYVQQGARPKRNHEDIKYATCHVECKELDEKLAVQLLPENNHSFPAGFKTISAEQECLLLKLRAPSKMLEDIETFRMALRALLIQIAHAGNIDFNKPSTITMKLTFTDDLTEDEIKVIKEISGKLFHSQRIVASVNYPAVAVSYETRGVNIDENCRKCENLQTEVIIQRTTIEMLEFKNRELIFSIIELELLDEWKERKRSKLALENRHLREIIHEAAASDRKFDRQQEKQDSAGEIEGLFENVQEKRKRIDSSSQTSPLFCMNCLSAYLFLLTRCAETLLTQYFALLKDAISDGKYAMQQALVDDEATKSTDSDEDTHHFCTDIVILHSDTDTIEAQACQKLLMKHIDIPHFKVDLSTQGGPLLSNLFNTCRLMFIFQTKNFESDPQASFENLMYRLQDPQITRRIIPLKVDKTIITELSPIIPLKYVTDISDEQFPIFKREVGQLVEYWRRVLP
ncbi:uncharacterized protein LOC134689761 [Mytilus trossulus]|uniref:uncharacterized protein LOC134689761 n=1 Tax=Mytilus trossulus TaxID=6551 RepID=UPI003007E369